MSWRLLKKYLSNYTQCQKINYQGVFFFLCTACHRILPCHNGALPCDIVTIHHLNIKALFQDFETKKLLIVENLKIWEKIVWFSGFDQNVGNKKSFHSRHIIKISFIQFWFTSYYQNPNFPIISLLTNAQINFLFSMTSLSLYRLKVYFLEIV